MSEPKRACKNCEWWDLHEHRGHDGDFGYCRIEPPVYRKAAGRWPTTHEMSWCGEYEPSEAYERSQDNDD